jgi:hypothetical protein
MDGACQNTKNITHPMTKNTLVCLEFGAIKSEQQQENNQMNQKTQ